jgi:hypothetical protein
MTIFVGDGPFKLENGKQNPFAKGLLISDATIGLVKEGNGDSAKYAIDAEGQVSVVGISDLSLSGPISFRLNDLEQGIDKTISVTGSAARKITVKFNENEVRDAAGKAFSEFKGVRVPIELSVAGQSMSGEFSVDRFSSKSDQDLDSIRFEFNQLSASLGDGSKDFLTLSQGDGDLLVMPEGVAFKGSGSVSLESNGVDAMGTIELQILHKVLSIILSSHCQKSY